jgi:hypothetical protein
VLVAIGLGIRIVGQLTVEALAEIRLADRLHYLAANATDEAVLRELKPGALSLAPLYAPGKPRERTYEEMVEAVLGDARTGARTCLALYGHPGIFAYPAHEAIRRAKAEGIAARMVAGVSADACLFADLGLDPGSSGYRSFEATDFLMRPRPADPSSLLVLWQAGAIGYTSIPGPDRRNPGLALLAERLAADYPAGYECIVYRAGLLPLDPPEMRRVALSALGTERLHPADTLCLPPCRPAEVDAVALEALSGLLPP